ncbi:MAG: cation-translocating P-type ATPase [Gemmataceae bacterium]|nr:cation-translocating P-type ATPase [Gemmataceae bacterium]
MNLSGTTGDDTTLRGLTTREVAERIGCGQVNRTPRSSWRDFRDIFARNLFTLFNALVAPAAVALFLLAEYRGAWAVSAMAVINSAIGLAQELRAKRHLDKLALLAEGRARVVRDGAELAIPSGDVVLDDCLLLGPGEGVVADGPVLLSRFLEVDEALLTGESDPVPRKVGDRLLSGSFCVAGDGAYRAERVGPAALVQQTSAQAREYRHVASPMQRTIDRLIRILTAIAVTLCFLYVGLYFLHEFPTTDLVQMIAATVTSLVPQGLVLMTTVAFTLGAVRMSTRGAVVQRLSAVESMASVSVMCLDKTGTLTTNRLCLDRIQGLHAGINESEIRSRLRQFVSYTTDSQSRSIQALRETLGDLLEQERCERIDQVPFKSQNRYSAVRLRMGSAERVLVLGAWEALRPRCGDALSAEHEAAWRALLPSGLRLLLFAEPAEQIVPPFDGVLPAVSLRPLALVALRDELRPNAADVLRDLAGQGIRIMFLSGDNPETVRATIVQLGLPLRTDDVVTGDRLSSDADRTALIEGNDIFGRVAPQQKLEIVTALQAKGWHVAMIGDGVNDILSIKRADLGIAMGEGSAATRTVADLVLENNQFDLLPATLEEGRVLLRNLRRTSKLFLLKNVYALLLIVGALGVFRLDFPFEPVQVTLLNALTIGTPAFLITLSRERSRAPSRVGFLREVGGFALCTGLIIGAAGLTTFLLSARWRGDDLIMQRTLVLSTLILLGVGSLWRVLSHGESGAWTGNRLPRMLALLAVPAYGLAMYWGPTAYYFNLEPLFAAEWMLVLAVAVPGFLLCKLTDWLGLG